MQNSECRMQNEDIFFRTIRAAFGQRRKTLPNALANSGAFGKDKQQITQILNSVGIDEKRRGETLSLEEFARISDAIFEK